MFPPGDGGGDPIQRQRTAAPRRPLMDQGPGLGQGRGRNMTPGVPRGPMPGMGAPQGLGGGVPPMAQRAAMMRGAPPSMQGPPIAPPYIAPEATPQIDPRIEMIRRRQMMQGPQY